MSRRERDTPASGISAEGLIRIWESGLGRHSIDQALSALTISFPGEPWQELATLPIGRRDARLLNLHERLFGPRLACRTDCPGCDEPLEFEVEIDDIRTSPDPSEAQDTYRMSMAEIEVTYRLPTSRDLAAVAGFQHVAEARAELASACVTQIAGPGGGPATSDLSDDVVSALAEEMALHDPQAEVQIDVGCPACGHRWDIALDILSHFWMKPSAAVKRILREVDTLARTYGWSEAEILSMSVARRRLYLEIAV